jgi:tetratricopeptide (TPR) repeat protein
LRQLAVPGAWLGAALWALHPVQVESVAWVSETKNTESGFFILLTIFLFLKGLEWGDRTPQHAVNGYAILAVVSAALAMLCKSPALLLPFVLLLILWWTKRLLRWRELLRVAPFAAVAIVVVLMVVSIVKNFGGSEYHWAPSWLERVALAGYVFWFYLGKLIWPDPLLTVYPGWSLKDTPWLYVPTLTLVGTCVLLWHQRNSWARGCCFAFSYYLINLLPVMGLFSVTGFRYSPVEDHLQYMASIGPLALAGAGLATLARTVSSGAVWVPRAVISCLLLVLAGLAWGQAGHYQSSQSLWTYNLSKNPGCGLACYNLGLDLANQGRIEEAQTYFRKSLALDPDYAPAHVSLGLTLAQQGDWAGAAAEDRTAVAEDAYQADAEEHLGEALIKLNQVDEAMAHERRAAYLEPLSPVPHNDLGVLLFQKGQVAEAVAEYEKALENDPQSEQTRSNVALALTQVGITLLQDGKVEEAQARFEEALKYDPTLAQAHSDLGIADIKAGDLSGAEGQFEEAVRDQPDDATAQANLARIKAMLSQGPSGP